MKIIASEYGDSPNNFHIDRVEPKLDTLSVVLTYPPWTEAENKTGQVRYVTFDQEATRASGGIRVSFDYARNGYKIEQPTIFVWEMEDKVCDQGWREVAFIPAWHPHANLDD